MSAWLLNPASPTFASDPSPCFAPQGCEVAGGRYLLRPPADLQDRPQPRTILVFLHGWRESAEFVMADTLLTRFADAKGAWLVAPDGEGGTWRYAGSPAVGRDDVAFLEAVVADVKGRIGADPSRIILAGFSQGGSMVWNTACRRPLLASHFAAIAGGFWEPAATACSGVGVNLVHVHGLNDATVPMGGRSIRGGAFRQSDVRRDWRIWLEEDGCAPGPDRQDIVSDRTCQRWTTCARRQLAFCQHDGGHQVHAEDLEAVWSFVDQTPTVRLRQVSPGP